MSEKQIKPDKITKPIQLLAAWLVGLISLSSCFLFAATNFKADSWQSGLLVIAAISNVPIFLGAVFLLQTKFRPELQEDSYYATYLNKKTNEEVRIPKSNAHLNELSTAIARLEEKLQEPEEKDSTDSIGKFLLVGINKYFEDRKNIIGILSSFGVQKITSFGSENAPPDRVMSISNHLNTAEIDFAISIAREIGMEGYNFFNNREEQTEEVILIGSYGDPDFFLSDNGA